MRRPQAVALSAALIASAAILAIPVQATTLITEVFTGQVSSVSNVSGPLANVAVGDSWTATFVFDLDEGVNGNFLGQRYLRNNGSDNPLLDATLVIDGGPAIDVGPGGHASQTYL